MEKEYDDTVTTQQLDILSMSSSPPQDTLDVESNHVCFIHLHSNNRNNNVGDSSKNFYKKSRCGTKIQMQRPKTSLKKVYRTNGILPDSDEIMFDNYLKSNLFLSNDNCNNNNYNKNGNVSKDILLWTFGTRQTGKTTLLYGNATNDKNNIQDRGYIPKLFQHIALCTFLEKKDPNETETIVTFSYLATTIDDSDRAYDCLFKRNENCDQQLKIRQNQDGTFYMENQQEVICQTEQQLNQVFQQAIIQLGQIKETIGVQRMHTLAHIRIYKTYQNGDLETQNIQILDLCGVERASPTLKQKDKQVQRKSTTKTKNKISAGKEDRTTKALIRVVDSMVNKSSHHPWRDSKITRLISKTFGRNSPFSLNIACICTSVDDGMFDEASAMMEFMSKIYKISSSPSNKKDIASSTSGTTTSYTRMRNRLKEQNEAQSKVDKLAVSLGANPSDFQNKKSSSIQLDMNSPIELVELRDALLLVERLEIDDVKILKEDSNAWWSYHNEAAINH